MLDLGSSIIPIYFDPNIPYVPVLSRISVLRRKNLPEYVFPNRLTGLSNKLYLRDSFLIYILIDIQHTKTNINA